MSVAISVRAKTNNEWVQNQNQITSYGSSNFCQQSGFLKTRTNVKKLSFFLNQASLIERLEGSYTKHYIIYAIGQTLKGIHALCQLLPAFPGFCSHVWSMESVSAGLTLVTRNCRAGLGNLFLPRANTIFLTSYVGHTVRQMSCRQLRKIKIFLSHYRQGPDHRVV